MAKTKKPIKAARRAAKAAKPAKPVTPTAAPPRPEALKSDAPKTETPKSASSAVIRDLAESPPPKKIETLKAAGDAVDRATAGRKVAKRDPAQSAMRVTEKGEMSKEAQTNGGSNPTSGSSALSPQAFAVEMQRMAKESIEQTTHVLEQLRGARGLDEIVSLQTAFMQQSFQRYTNFAHRLGELMIASQAGLFRQGEAALRNFRSLGGQGVGP